jgi:hypothetical protein
MRRESPICGVKFDINVERANLKRMSLSFLSSRWSRHVRQSHTQKVGSPPCFEIQVAINRTGCSACRIYLLIR